MEYKVMIDSFTGPLDLLLHLLKIEDIKIEDISIELVTNQYLNYINKMKELNLDIASEYLVMASELIEMKSRILLPKKEEEIEIDDRQNLIDRLLEYKAYKEITEKFKELEEQRKEIYTKEPSNLKEFKQEEIVEVNELSIDILVEAFKKLLEKKEIEKPLDTKVTTKEYSVQIRNKEIKQLLIKKKRVEFTELFETYTKDYFVVTFLSILDLSKKQELEIEQENNFSKIFLVNRG